jgi:heme A synthase
MELLVILAVVIVIGAILGGNSFGETVRKGCGCITIIILLLIAAAIYVGSNVDIDDADTSHTPNETTVLKGSPKN